MEHGSEHDGTPNHSIHVEGFEPKHLLDAEPADDFPHREGDPEQQAEKEEANHVSRVIREGRTKWDTANPPIKKPITAIKLGHCMALRPLMA